MTRRNETRLMETAWLMGVVNNEVMHLLGSEGRWSLELEMNIAARPTPIWIVSAAPSARVGGHSFVIDVLADRRWISAARDLEDRGITAPLTTLMHDATIERLRLY